MSQYIILLRNEKIDFSSFSPEEYQKLVAHFEEWNSELLKKGKLIGSANLKGNGKTLRLKEDRLVIDGPYCETKEAIAGLFLIYSSDLNEAVEYAKGCPFLAIGGSVEVMQVPSLEIEGLDLQSTEKEN